MRSASRLLEIHPDTIMRLAVRVGQGCTAVHGKLMVNLLISRIELDEDWNLVKRKRRNATETDPDTVGDQYICLAMDGTENAIISWLVGKRNYRNSQRLVDGAQFRVLGTPEISSDGCEALNLFHAGI
jgi:hypothetical protein